MTATLAAFLPLVLPVGRLPRRCCGRFTSWRALAYVIARVPACGMLAGFTVGAAQACPVTAPRSSFADPAAHLGQHAVAIAQRLAAWQRTSGHQLFVVIASSLDEGMSVEQCAVAVVQNWKLGRKSVDDGVLLLVDIKDRKMRIEVGYCLEGVLTDARSSRIIREVMQPLFARGEFAEGIDRGVSPIMTVIGSAGPAPGAAAESSSADVAKIGTVGKFVVSRVILMILLLSTTLGIVGLLFFGMATTGLVSGAVRWFTIRRNVEKYHLNKSHNKILT